MTAPGGGQNQQDMAAQEAFDRASMDFLAASIRVNEIHMDVIGDEIHLNDATIELLQTEAKVESQVPEAERPADHHHEVFDAVEDAKNEPASRLDRIADERDDLTARYHELHSQPPEMRDPAEMQALADRMHDLVNQADAVHEDFTGAKHDLDARIADEKSELQGALDAHAASGHEATSWFGTGGDHHQTPDTPAPEANVSHGHDAPAYDGTAASGDGT